MTTAALIILIVLFFVTSAVGVVTGSNSLVTVPVMFQFGINEKVAIATNMFGLTFMSAGASIPFLRKGMVDLRRITPLILLTIVGSAIGAALVGSITAQGLKLIVSASMIAVVAFIFLRPQRTSSEPGPTRNAIVYVVAFALAIYGGLFSGGYVTILTAVLTAFFGMSFGESVAATKVINVFSSLVATMVCAWQGLIDFQLGIILAIAMFAGAYVGAHYASEMSEKWLSRIFLATVILLAIKTLIDAMPDAAAAL